MCDENGSQIWWSLRKRRTDLSLYSAQSERQSMIKVGIAANVGERLCILNREAYGETSDWSAVRSVTRQDAGKLEIEIGKALYSSRRCGLTYRNGVECIELYSDPSASLAVFDRIVGQS